KQAWSRIILRHPVLRTCFRWDLAERALQRVKTKVEWPWVEQDWRTFTDAEQEEGFADFLAVDRRLGFDLADVPLFRFTFLRLGETHHRLIWTYHHILLDATARESLLREVFAFYEAFVRDQDLSLPQPRRFRDYIDWLQQQDFNKDQSFWRQLLKG